MSFWFINATARSAWAAATSQQGQLEGLRDLWSGQMSVRCYSAADAHLATVTHATPIIDTTTTPYSLRLGAWVAESHVQDGTAAYCILAVPVGADILRCDVSLAGAISDPGGRVRVDIGTTLRIQAAAGLPATETPAGTWQALTIPSVLRKSVEGLNTSDSSVIEASPATTVEGRSPVSSTVLPWRAFCRAAMGEPGILYYQGSLHSDYLGNEIDRIDITDLSGTTVGLSINHQPNVPPRGPASGYGAGSSGYVYKQYGTPLASGADWQPYAFHNWAFNTYHPAHGYLLHCSYALANGATVGADPDGNGSGYVQSASVFYAGNDYRRLGMVRYYKNARYELVTTMPQGLATGEIIPAGVSDYSPFRRAVLAFFCNQYSLEIVELLPNNTWAALDLKSVATISTGITSNYWKANKAGNGLLALAMDEHKFLLYTTPGAPMSSFTTTRRRFNFDHQVFTYDANTKVMTVVTLPDAMADVFEPYALGEGGQISFAVDRSARHVYCYGIAAAQVSSMTQGTMRVWRASFDDLEAWSEIAFTGTPPTLRWSSPYDREPAKVYNGHLVFLTQSSGKVARLDRVKVTGGENPPVFAFHRHDYSTQNFQLASPNNGAVLAAKHCNHAYRSVDGRYYQMAGDIVQSFVQSTYALTVSDTSYTFTQELDELTPAASGYLRPASPDDGAWAYCGATNTNAALADRFVYFRGGDGIGYRSNTYMAAAYVDDAAAIADRWSVNRAYLYDAANKRFTDANVESWTVVKGSFNDGGQHPTAWPTAASRAGVWDGSTNTMFKFAAFGSGFQLLAYKFDEQEIRIWNTGGQSTVFGELVYLDGERMPNGGVADPQGRWFTDNYNNPPRKHSFIDFSWEQGNGWVDESNGKLYIVSPATGLLWCFETRGVETSGAVGLTIPMSVVGERVPFDERHLHHQDWDGWPVRMGTYMVPFKGGLFVTIDTPGGNSGTARYAYWRRLGYAGEWTPITLPRDWQCNSLAPKSRAIDNDEFLGIQGISPTDRVIDSFYLCR